MSSIFSVFDESEEEMPVSLSMDDLTSVWAQGSPEESMDLDPDELRNFLVERAQKRKERSLEYQQMALDVNRGR